MRWPVALLAATAWVVAPSPAARPARAAPGPAPTAADSTRGAVAAESTAADTTVAPTAVPSGASLGAQLVAIETAAAGLPPTQRRVLDELIAAARELAAEGDAEAAALVVEDARSLVQGSAR